MPASKHDKVSPDRTDWAALRNLPDSEIERIALEDEDNPASTDAHGANAVIGGTSAKTVVNAKFDADVVAWFKGQGRGYQSRMNAVLRMYMDAHAKKAG